LWTVIVMPNGILVPPLRRPLVPLTQPTAQWRKEIDNKTTWFRIDNMVQNLMQSHQHISGILHIRVSYMINLSNSI
jgi:hypothetical protein